MSWLRKFCVHSSDLRKKNASVSIIILFSFSFSPFTFSPSSPFPFFIPSFFTSTSLYFPNNPTSYPFPTTHFLLPFLFFFFFFFCGTICSTFSGFSPMLHCYMHSLWILGSSLATLLLELLTVVLVLNMMVT